MMLRSALNDMDALSAVFAVAEVGISIDDGHTVDSAREGRT